MKIGLFFGSFNPVHNGHMIIANMIHQYTDLDKIWFVVSPQNPFKQKNSLLKEQDRLHLLHLAADDNPAFGVSDIEFRLPQPSYTIDTLIYLKEKYPKHSFSLIMGEDNLAQIERWKNGHVILRDYNIYCYRRKSEETLSPNYPKNVTILDFPLIDISATFIRNLLKDNYSARYFLPEKVVQYIEDYKLYKQ